MAEDDGIVVAAAYWYLFHRVAATSLHTSQQNFAIRLGLLGSVDRVGVRFFFIVSVLISLIYVLPRYSAVKDLNSTTLF